MRGIPADAVRVLRGRDRTGRRKTGRDDPDADAMELGTERRIHHGDSMGTASARLENEECRGPGFESPIPAQSLSQTDSAAKRASSAQQRISNIAADKRHDWND